MSAGSWSLQVQPLWLGRLSLQDVESYPTTLAVQIPRGLEMGVVMYRISQVAHVFAPARSQIDGAPNIDFPRGYATYLVNAGALGGFGNGFFDRHARPARERRWMCRI